ncbi:MAG: biopolymer transport protein ExbD [Sphingobacteriales bacterium]|jgi:biopolymer transport protein ExbD
MARKKNRLSSEINAGSMADIAFLLLIFFLVTTTINVDTGISLLLPPMPEETMEEPPPIKERNILKVLVNSNNQLLVEGQLMEVKDLRNTTKEFLTNPSNDPELPASTTKAVISLKNDRGTSYNTYISVQNELKAAYREVRDESSTKLFGKPYEDLDKDKQKEIREIHPQKISEAEPEDIGGEN